MEGMTEVHYEYEEGAVRWARWHGEGDVRAHRSEGWKVRAEMLDRHPVTGKQLPHPSWWIREEKE
jgi:hypothetical protein